MSDISSISGASRARALYAASATRQHDAVAGRNAQGAPAPRGQDDIELSDVGYFVAKLHTLPPVRQELVDRVKDEIKRGVYETPEKIDQAIEELMKDLEGRL